MGGIATVRNAHPWILSARRVLSSWDAGILRVVCFTVYEACGGMGVCMRQAYPVVVATSKGYTISRITISH